MGTMRTNLNWSIVNSKLAFNTIVPNGEDITIIVLQKPLKLTLADDAVGLTSSPITLIDEEGDIFADTPAGTQVDDGFNTQREDLLVWRVAAALLYAADTRRAMEIEGKAERTEREMEGVKDYLQSNEIPAANNSPKVIDVDS